MTEYSGVGSIECSPVTSEGARNCTLRGFDSLEVIAEMKISTMRMKDWKSIEVDLPEILFYFEPGGECNYDEDSRSIECKKESIWY